MKKSLLLAALGGMAISAMAADNDIITLDLTKATTPLTFDATYGNWDKTLDETATSIESQVFSFAHFCNPAWMSWWGMTASNSADNAGPADAMTQQFSNMAQGGILLDADGSIKKDEYGAPAISAKVPYLVCFGSESWGPKNINVTFNDGKFYAPVGVYVNLTSLPYYSIELGDPFSRQFTNGDWFRLTAHGVAADNTERTAITTLASFTNGDLTINRTWKYFDLSALGDVNEIYFTLSSTDNGEWGMNTPAYFALDKLMVRPATGASVTSVHADGSCIRYNRDAQTIEIGSADFAAVYDAAGRIVVSSDAKTLSVASLPAGVYVVKAADASLKFTK